MAKHTIYFEKQPRIISTGTIAGPKECAGVVGKYVDRALSDDMFGESTYEKAGKPSRTGSLYEKKEMSGMQKVIYSILRILIRPIREVL